MSEKDISEGGLAVFLNRRAKPLAIVLGLAVVFCAGFVIVSIVLEARNKKAIEILENYIEQDKNQDEKDAPEDYIAGLEKLAKSYSGYPAARAFLMLGGIYSAQEKWELAEAAYINSSKKGEKTHLYGVSLFNAAVCAENLNKTDEALDYYQKAAAAPDFAEAAHAQFAAGVLLREQGKTGEAKEAFQAVIDNFENDKDWTSLANTALIMMEIK